MQADLIHSCLHRVMAVLPEPEEGDSPQEVSVAPTVGGDPQEVSATPVVGGGGQPPGAISGPHGGPVQGWGLTAGLAASLVPAPVPGHRAGPQGLVDEPPSVEHDAPGSAGHGGGVWQAVALCASWGWPASQWAGPL